MFRYIKNRKFDNNSKSWELIDLKLSLSKRENDYVVTSSTKSGVSSARNHKTLKDALNTYKKLISYSYLIEKYGDLK